MVSNVGHEPRHKGWSGECTGCAVCAAVCPTGAISMMLTAEGFYEPSVDDERCTSCGACEAVCNRCHPAEAMETSGAQVFSAKHRDRDLLMHSSSGGVSSELMGSCIDGGYAVVGVAYDTQQQRAIARVATSVAELPQFRGSKYFQSDNADAYRHVLKDRTGQRFAVFGTPCQIYGLSRAADLRGIRDRLVLVDVFCHGCPSLNLWTKYLKYVGERTGKPSFDVIEFRSKVHGWHEFAFVFRSDSQVYVNQKANDPFYSLFFSKNAFCLACYDCAARSTTSYCDVRLGDFWGYEYDMDTEGVSAVIAATEVGKRLFARIEKSFDVRMHAFAEAIQAQSYGSEHVRDDAARARVLMALSSEVPLERIVDDERRRQPLTRRVWLNMKNVLRILPPQVYFALRKRVHRGVGS